MQAFIAKNVLCIARLYHASKTKQTNKANTRLICVLTLGTK